MHACMYACIYGSMFACMHVYRKNVCLLQGDATLLVACPHTYVCMHACMYACMHLWMYVFMHLWMYENVCLLQGDATLLIARLIHSLNDGCFHGVEDLAQAPQLLLPPPHTPFVARQCARACVCMCMYTFVHVHVHVCACVCTHTPTMRACTFM